MRIYTGMNVSLKIEGLKLEGVTRAEYSLLSDKKARILISTMGFDKKITDLIGQENITVEIGYSAGPDNDHFIFKDCMISEINTIPIKETLNEMTNSYSSNEIFIKKYSRWWEKPIYKITFVNTKNNVKKQTANCIEEVILTNMVIDAKSFRHWSTR